MFNYYYIGKVKNKKPCNYCLMFPISQDIAKIFFNNNINK